MAIHGVWRFASLGSGSRGNGTLISKGSKNYLVDCGFTLKQTVMRLEKLNLAAEDLTGILVTHEHGDHIRGVLPLARKYGIPVFASHGTARARGVRGVNRGKEKEVTLLNSQDIALHVVEDERQIVLGDIWVKPVSVPHDAREPLQYIFGDESVQIGVLTDIGHITPHVEACYRGCDALLVESNHDIPMLENSSYPAHIKQRVGGLHGHLSNAQTAEFLVGVNHDDLQHVVIGHMSEQNNSVACVESAMLGITEELNQVTFASQDNGTGWIEVSTQQQFDSQKVC